MFEILIPENATSIDDARAVVASPDTVAESLKATPLDQRIALDTETSSRRPTECFIVGLSITCAGRNFYSPLCHKTPIAQNDSLNQVLDLLRSNLLGREIAFHHAPFDLIVLDRHGLTIAELDAKIFDTEIAAHLVDSSRRRVGESNKLKELSKYYWGIDQPTYEEVAGDLGFQFANLEVGARYAAFDTNCTLRLSHLLEQSLKELGSFEYFRAIEMENVWNTTEMMRNGVPIDEELLLKMKDDSDQTLAELEDFIFDKVGHIFDISSPQQLGYALFGQHRGTRKFQPKGRTDSGSYDTSGDVLRRLYRDEKASRDLVLAILHFRKLKRIKVAYLDRFAYFLNRKTRRVHPSLSPSTITGRYRCSSPNLLGLPKTYEFDWSAILEVREDGCKGDTEATEGTPNSSSLGKWDFSVRKLIRAPAGSMLVVADFSQIDMRGIGHYSEDKKLLGAFIEDRDLHLETLQIVRPESIHEIFQGKCQPGDIKARDEEKRVVILNDGREISLTEEEFARLEAERKDMKAVNFGISYGMGPAALLNRLNNPDTIDDLKTFVGRPPWSMDQAEDMVSKFFKRFSRIPAYKQEVKRYFFGKGDPNGIPGGAFRNVFGRTVFTAPYSRLWKQPVTFDIRTQDGSFRLQGKVLGISEDGLLLRLHEAKEILIAEHPPMTHESTHVEKDRVKQLHDEAEEGALLFSSEPQALDTLEDNLLGGKRPLSSDLLFEFEKAISTLSRRHDPARAGFLAKEAFHPEIAECYRECGFEIPQSLPYTLLDHKLVEAIQLHPDGGFLRFARWSGALRELASYVISSTSTDIAKKAMIRVREEVKRRWPGTWKEFRLLLCVHDELVYEVPEKDAPHFKDLLRAVMQEKPHPDFRAKVDAKAAIGGTYEEAKP